MMSISGWIHAFLFASTFVVGGLFSIHGAYANAPENWSEVTGSEKLAVLQMLANQTRGNYETIRTWKGTYAVQIKQLLSKEYVASEFANKLSGGNVSELIQEFDFTLHFALDGEANSFYWEKINSRMRFRKPSSIDIINIPNVTPADGRYVLTAEHCLRFKPDTIWPAFTVLPDHPEAQHKHTVFRFPPEYGKQRESDLPDPRSFFGLSSTLKFWEELGLYVNELGEGASDAVRKRADKILKVFQAADSSGVWYRLVNELISPQKDSNLYLTTIWCPSTGHNPVSYVMAKDRDGARVISRKQWQWKQEKGTYIPAYFEEHTLGQNGEEIPFQRKFELVACIVNPRIDPQTFSYRGLGLKDGELIMDKIERAVYVLKDGKPEKLADFGEKYYPPGTSRWALSKGWQLTIYSGLLIVLIAVFVARQYRKRRRLA